MNATMTSLVGMLQKDPETGPPPATLANSVAPRTFVSSATSVVTEVKTEPGLLPAIDWLKKFSTVYPPGGVYKGKESKENSPNVEESQSQSTTDTEERGRKFHNF